MFRCCAVLERALPNQRSQLHGGVDEIGKSAEDR